MTASEHAVSLAMTVAEAAADKLASDIMIIDVSERLVISMSLPCETWTRTRSRGAPPTSIP